jgi:hypothetical protein
VQVAGYGLQVAGYGFPWESEARKVSDAEIGTCYRLLGASALVKGIDRD